MAGIPDLKIGATTTTISKMAKEMRMTLVEPRDFLWSLQRIIMHKRFPTRPTIPIRFMNTPMIMKLKKLLSTAVVPDPPSILLFSSIPTNLATLSLIIVL